MLATTRWGSYLPFGAPPYIADVVLFALIAERIAANARGRAKAIGVDPVLGAFSIGLIAWGLVEIPVGQLTVTAFKDAAPYLYAITIFLVGPPNDSPSARQTAAKAITAALVFHAAWVTGTTLFPTLPESLPHSGKLVPFFELRPDVDSAICGLLVVIGLHRALSGRDAIKNLAFAGWGTALVMSLYSRAGLLAFFAELLIFLLLSPARARIFAQGRRLVAPVVVALVIVALPPAWLAAENSQPVQRLLSTSITSKGTASSRWKSWMKISAYLERDPARLVRGVGFGPDFLHASGGDIELLGGTGTSEDVRAPHNYFVNTWARLGLVGVFLVVGILFAGWRLVIKLVRAEPDLSDADVLAIATVVGLPVAGTFGVVLEAPFGAIPYFWALGHLSVRNVQLGTTIPVAPHQTGQRIGAEQMPRSSLPKPSPPQRAESAGNESKLDINGATFE